jgi:hypothetical protein
MSSTMQAAGAVIFALALAHTFAAGPVGRLAHRYPRHGRVLHALGEVELVFALWAIVLAVAMVAIDGGAAARDYLLTRHYTEPLFVFVILVIASSQPVLQALRSGVEGLAHALPLPHAVATAWLCLAALPLLGSFVTEPAAMTLCALLLAPRVFRADVPERLKYFTLGVLFVNVSIGGTLTPWQWDTAFMLRQFGWKAALVVVANATVAVWALRRCLHDAPDSSPAARVPLGLSAVHIAFLAAAVVLAHSPAGLVAVLLVFVAIVRLSGQHRRPLLVVPALLVALFLAGLVVLGGAQQWWLQPLVTALDSHALFFGALALTAITDNAALTYLGSLVEGITPAAQYALVAGAVAGGGLTVIANAPNPAGAALLRHGFRGSQVRPLPLLAGALLPTALAALVFAPY